MTNPLTRISTLALASLASLSLLAAPGCKKKGDDVMTTRASAAVAAADKPAAAAGSGSVAATPGTSAGLIKPVVDHRKVIRTGTLELDVEDYAVARGKLDALVAELGGYVDASEVRSGSRTHATVTVRIPAEAFGPLLPRLQDIGRVLHEQNTASDVTDQYVDVAARVASEKAIEHRLLELAADRTASMDSLLSVERELARVRGEIERAEGHLRQWDDQVALSTLTIEMTSKAPVVAVTAPEEPGLATRAGATLHDSVTALREFASGLLLIVIALAPWTVFAVPAVMIGRAVVRRRRKGLPVATVA
jgi:hypothetical protein